MDVRPFLPLDIQMLEAQPKQSLGHAFLSRRQAGDLATYPSYTGWVDGKPVICAGLVRLWEGRYVAWAYVAWHAGPHFMAVHRAVKKNLREHPYRRIETAVACDFEPGHRWARMLGFELEAERMRGYSPFGEDHALYAMVR